MNRKTCIYGTPLSQVEDLIPEKSVLLMIDMEKAFVEPKAALHIMGAKYTVPACEALLNDARDLGIKIIWIKRVYSEDGSDMETPRRKMLKRHGVTGVLAPGSTGVNSIEEPDGLTRLDSETVMKGVPIRFQIDRTAPSAVLTGIEDRGVYNANGRPVTIRSHITTGRLYLSAVLLRRPMISRGRIWKT